MRKLLIIAGLALLVVGYGPGLRAAEEVTLIKGLDGGDYQPYKPSVIERVQRQLSELGYYQGPVDGRLSQETMEALGQFQKENRLVVTGIPTPRTRQRLQELLATDEGQSPAQK